MHGNSGYDPEYCELIIETFKRGGTLADFCVKVGKSRSTVFGWVDRYPKTFGESYKLAREYGKVFRDNKALENMWIDQSEGAVNFDIKSFLKLTSRRFSDLDKETPPPKILDKKSDPDLVKASRKLVEATVTENLPPEQARTVGNILKSLLEVKEKEAMAEQLNKVEKMLADGMQTNGSPVDSPEPEYEEIEDDNKAQ